MDSIEESRKAHYSSTLRTFDATDYSSIGTHAHTATYGSIGTLATCRNVHLHFCHIQQYKYTFTDACHIQNVYTYIFATYSSMGIHTHF